MKLYVIDLQSWSKEVSNVLEDLNISSTLLASITLISQFSIFRSKFGKGFQIIVKLKSSEEVKEEEVLNSIKAKIISKFESCIVTDEHLDYIHFHVSNPSTSWHSLFTNMESVKAEFHVIQDYSIQETTLEQIFLGFARGDGSANQGNHSVATLL